jgi:hypothetical protein
MVASEKEKGAWTEIEFHPDMCYITMGSLVT